MKKNITIQVPEKFNFDKTICLIQRGIDDPINQIHDNKLVRSYSIENQFILLEIEKVTNLNCIKVAILKGGISIGLNCTLSG
jgi:hypothetical protein